MTRNRSQNQRSGYETMEDTDKLLREIFNTVIEKFQKGAIKYGDYDPLNDSRDMLAETEAEILDAINYLAMGLIKLRTMRSI
jgi:hypothetical protein